MRISTAEVKLDAIDRAILTGRGGITLDQKWDGELRSLHGTQFSGFTRKSVAPQ